MPPPQPTAPPPVIDLSDIPNAAPINGGDGHMVGKGGIDISDIPDAAPEKSLLEKRRAHAAAVDANLKGHEPVLEALQGFGAAAGNTVQTLASPIRKLFGMQPATPFETPDTTAGKVGHGAEQLAEFAVPEALAGKLSSVINLAPKLRAAGYSKLVAQYGRAAVEGALKGLGAFGTSKLQGDSTAAAGTVGAISAASPIAGQLVNDAVPMLRAGARAGMAKVLGAGAAANTPALEKDIAKAVPAALDTGLPSSWQSWGKSASRARTAAGETLEAMKAGPAGDALVDKTPVVQALDDLIQSKATHMVPPKGFTPTKPMQGAAGGVTPVVFNQPLVSAAEGLKDVLDQYPGKYLQARQLHDIKKMWDTAVYAAPESGQLGFNLGDRLRQVDKLAKLTATNAIRDVLKVDAPTIAGLDAAVSTQIKLHQVIRKAATAASKGGVSKQIATRVGSLVGTAAGGYEGGWSGAVMGGMIGGTTGRMLKLAIESPTWRVLPAATRTAVADAIVSGKVDQVRRLLTPIVAGGISQWERPAGQSTTSSGSGAISVQPTNSTPTGQELGQQ